MLPAILIGLKFEISTAHFFFGNKVAQVVFMAASSCPVLKNYNMYLLKSFPIIDQTCSIHLILNPSYLGAFEGSQLMIASLISSIVTASISCWLWTSINLGKPRLIILKVVASCLVYNFLKCVTIALEFGISPESKETFKQFFGN